MLDHFIAAYGNQFVYDNGRYNMARQKGRAPQYLYGKQEGTLRGDQERSDQVQERSLVEYLAHIQNGDHLSIGDSELAS